jgi:hypothetical protein
VISPRPECLLRWISYFAAAALCACGAKKLPPEAGGERPPKLEAELPKAVDKVEEQIVERVSPGPQEWLAFSAVRHRMFYLQGATPVLQKAAGSSPESAGEKKHAQRVAGLLAEMPEVEASYAKQKEALLAKLDEEKRKLLETEMVREVEVRELMDARVALKYPSIPAGEQKAEVDAAALAAVEKDLDAKRRSLQEIREQLAPELIGAFCAPEDLAAMYQAAERAGVLKRGDGWPRARRN